nr:MAG TPA: hypothetical protein [Caudoviricetes sp.]
MLILVMQCNVLLMICCKFCYSLLGLIVFLYMYQ